MIRPSKFILKRYRKSKLWTKNVTKNLPLHQKFMYWEFCQKWPNLKTPKTFDEKLLYLNSHDYFGDPLVSKCADKIAVQDYVREKGYPDILNELYGTYTPDETIDTSIFPDSFVLKRNNDCNSFIIVKDKNKEKNLDARIKKLQAGFTNTFGYSTCECHYRDIPHKVLVEKYMEDSHGNFPPDYKFFCMNGVPEYLLICIGRNDHDNMLRFVVDMDFNLVPIMPDEKPITNEEIQQYKPENFDKMKEIATKLSEDFPFVRCDLYDFDGKIVFGELTFTPMGCFNHYFSEEGQLLLGNKLKLK